VVPVIEPAFLRPTMTPPGLARGRATSGATATDSTVDVASIASTADRKQRHAERANRKPLVGHVLAVRRLVALELISGESASVDASSLDMEGRELQLLAFVLSAPVRRSRPPSAHEVSCCRTPGRRSSGSEWPITLLAADRWFDDLGSQQELKAYVCATCANVARDLGRSRSRQTARNAQLEELDRAAALEPSPEDALDRKERSSQRVLERWIKSSASYSSSTSSKGAPVRRSPSISRSGPGRSPRGCAGRATSSERRSPVCANPSATHGGVVDEAFEFFRRGLPTLAVKIRFYLVSARPSRLSARSVLACTSVIKTVDVPAPARRRSWKLVRARRTSCWDRESDDSRVIEEQAGRQHASMSALGCRADSALLQRPRCEIASSSLANDGRHAEWTRGNAQPEASGARHERCLSVSGEPMSHAVMSRRRAGQRPTRRWSKQCSYCGRDVGEYEWRALKFIGFQDDGASGWLELRNHRCGTTLAVAVESS